jgi:hypothetical protein
MAETRDLESLLSPGTARNAEKTLPVGPSSHSSTLIAVILSSLHLAGDKRAARLRTCISNAVKLAESGFAD